MNVKQVIRIRTIENEEGQKKERQVNHWRHVHAHRALLGSLFPAFVVATTTFYYFCHNMFVLYGCIIWNQIPK